MILFLVLMISAVASYSWTEVEEKKEFDDFGKAIRSMSRQAADYIEATDRAMKDFNCALKNDDCDPWTDGMLIVGLYKANINCDVADSNILCDKARKMLGEEGLSQGDINRRLIEKTDQIMRPKAKGDRVLAVWKAMADYICYKIPNDCGFVSDMMNADEDLEYTVNYNSDAI